MAVERCAVCGLSANPRNVVIYKGKQYKLCSYRCRKKFEADEQRYVSSV